MTSIFDNLKQARAKLSEAQKLSLRVPGWGEGENPDTPEIWIVYRPAELDYTRIIMDRVSKAKGSKASEETLNANADVLVKCATRIFGRFEDQEHELGEVTDTGFDWSVLGESLGVEESRATAVCRAVFLKDGDLLSHARRLGEWSNLREGELDEDYSGE